MEKWKRRVEVREGGKREKRKKRREGRGPSKAELLRRERNWNVGSGRRY